MNLRDFLHFEHRTIKSLADELEIHPTHLYGYIKGRLRVSKKLARAIEKATQGKVKASEVIFANPTKKKIYKKDPLK